MQGMVLRLLFGIYGVRLGKRFKTSSCIMSAVNSELSVYNVWVEGLESLGLESGAAFPGWG